MLILFSPRVVVSHRDGENIGAKSAAQGYARSRLPEFTEEEKAYVRGTSDYFGLNHYSSKLAYRNESAYGYHEAPSFFDDADTVSYNLQEWKIGESDFVKVSFFLLFSIL